MSAPLLRSEVAVSPLAEFAFGARRLRSAAELPEPCDGLEMWWLAVAQGAGGCYSAARSTLRRLRIAVDDPVLLSLAASTEGSLLRQLGRHAKAAHDDGRAAALAVPRLPVAGAGQPTSGVGIEGYGGVPDMFDAAADALIGLAADALGTGRLALATRLLDRCAALPGVAGAPETDARSGPADSAPVRARARVRWHWVRAETALAGGDGMRALRDAEAALALAELGPSIRHQVKSRLLVAAAAGVTGDAERAAGLSEMVDEQCRAFALVPLRWACAMLRTGLFPAAPAAATADAAACRALIARRGGHFHDSAW